MSDTFGFDAEVVLLYSGYEDLQARTIQALDRIMARVPALGRVDQAIAIVLSQNDNAASWIARYSAINPQSRIIIGLSSKELIGVRAETWDLRNLFSKQLFSRDLFDYSLPLDNDTFFFGRSAVLAEHVDAVRRSENRGLFGLRKSGKTSLLFKIMRECNRGSARTIYLDCKLPAVYRLSGSEFLDKLSGEIAKLYGDELRGWQRGKDAYIRFGKLIERLPDDAQIGIILDEIEYVSFLSPTASHWKDDFVPVWQTIWSLQSQHRKICFIITGVNAAVAESDLVGSVQNPMFGIVKPKYLVGFDLTELGQMLRVIGRRMGLKFSNTAVNLLFDRYGGHPLLTRMICSHLHSQARAQGKVRPFEVSGSFISEGLDDREEEVVFYCNHIVSELKQSYPDEYEMLELLAVEDVIGFNDLSQDEGLIRHLKAYGLVDMSNKFSAKFKIPVLQKFIAREWRRRTGQHQLIYLTPPDGRATFVLSRVGSILRDLRAVDRRFSVVGTPALYGVAGPSEAELFASSKVVSDLPSLQQFLNQAQRSLVEPIDKTGEIAKIGKKYFFNIVRNTYPQLWDALARIRAYRNWLSHLELNSAAEQEYKRYLKKDLNGADPSDVVDGYFRIQSKTLNSLMIAIQTTLVQYE